MAKLRREYDIPNTTFYRELRQFSPREYRRIVNERHPHRRIDERSVWRRLENGESARSIATKIGISHGTLRKRLERLDRKRYQRIMNQRKRRYIVPMPEVWKKLEKGETLQRVATEYGIPPQTLRTKLVRLDRDRYMAIRQRQLLGPVPKEELFRRLASGESVTKIATDLGIYYSKMQRIFQRMDMELYEDIIERTRTIKAQGYGHEEARKQGADSDFELQVRKILEEHNIKFSSPTLKLGRHTYFPDFTTSDDIIVEAAGVTNRDYWERYREKTRNYAKHRQPALIVVPYNLRKRARDYLPHSKYIMSVWICDFGKDPDKYLRTLKSLKEAPQ
jgi:transposase-like protein